MRQQLVVTIGILAISSFCLALTEEETYQTTKPPEYYSAPNYDGSYSDVVSLDRVEVRGTYAVDISDSSSRGSIVTLDRVVVIGRNTGEGVRFDTAAATTALVLLKENTMAQNSLIVQSRINSILKIQSPSLRLAALVSLLRELSRIARTGVNIPLNWFQGLQVLINEHKALLVQGSNVGRSIGGFASVAFLRALGVAGVSAYVSIQFGTAIYTNVRWLQYGGLDRFFSAIGL